MPATHSYMHLWGSARPFHITSLGTPTKKYEKNDKLLKEVFLSSTPLLTNQKNKRTKPQITDQSEDRTKTIGWNDQPDRRVNFVWGAIKKHETCKSWKLKFLISLEKFEVKGLSQCSLGYSGSKNVKFHYDWFFFYNYTRVQTVAFIFI